jgi:hypothetical protein
MWHPWEKSVTFTNDGAGSGLDADTLDGLHASSFLSTSGTAASATTLTGLTATVAELNYVDGVTSNIQTQLNSKSATSHTHSNATTSASGFMSNTDKSKLNGIAAGANNYTLPNADSTVTGGVRVRLNGTTAYFTNNGTTA